jgi:hypothetical protein
MCGGRLSWRPPSLSPCSARERAGPRRAVVVPISLENTSVVDFKVELHEVRGFLSNDLAGAFRAAMGIEAPAGIRDRQQRDPLNYNIDIWQQAKRLPIAIGGGGIAANSQARSRQFQK